MKNSFVRRTLAVVLSVLMLVGMIPVHGVEAENNTTIDCVIKTAEDIAVAGNPGDIQGLGRVGVIENQGLVGEAVRFAPNAASLGTNATTSDRAVVAVENISLADYPFVVMVYKTNIEAENVNFNIVTANGTYSSSETKLFAPQTRVVGESAHATYKYTGHYGDTAEAIAIYVPIYSTSFQVMTADDYFDIEFIGFFESEEAYEAFDYDDYLANLTHTITFIDNNGNEISSSQYKHNMTVELPEALENYGFEFLGWSDGVNDELITEDFTATADITLTAVYKEIKYTVTFIDKIGDEISSLEYKLDSTVTLPAAPTLNGYTFLGWSDGVSDELITEDFTATADITLTATYKGNEYLVVFEPNGGSISESTKNVTFGSAYGELPIPVREEYEFSGWYTENGKSVTETTIVNTAQMHILYAKWTKVYTVKFLDVNGELLSSAEYKADEKVIFPDIVEITGYTFAGWSYSTDGKIITGNVYVDGDIELYARYDANKYMVIFVANGGSVSTTNKTVTYDSEYGTLPTPVREGFVFDGWFTSTDGGEKISENTIVKITEMQYLYAQWTQEDAPVIPGDVNADGKVDRKDLTRLAQYFARWDVEIDEVASDANGDGKVDRKDITRLAQYFARWDVELGK